jgi:hypothetical protein
MDVTAALRDGFADRPRIVIIDLHGMEDDDVASLPLWLAPRRERSSASPAAVRHDDRSAHGGGSVNRL